MKTRKPRYTGWRTENVRRQVGAYKLAGPNSEYRQTDCAKCGIAVVHQPRNSKGCRIVCWECAR